MTNWESGGACFDVLSTNEFLAPLPARRARVLLSWRDESCPYIGIENAVGLT